MAGRPQVGAHTRRGPGLWRCAAEPGTEARGVGLAELRGHRDRRGALLQARAQQRARRSARRAFVLSDEVASEPAPRRSGTRGHREVHRQVLAHARERRGPRRAGARVARAIEELLGVVELDFVHVHEPFAPSTSNAALRHSRALNVGSFHSPNERLLSTLVARRVVESFFGRLDARTASLPETARLMRRHFPGEYTLVADGAGAAAELEQIYAT